MSRLAATLRLDARLQARNNVYVIIGVAAAILAGLLRAVFTAEQLHFFMPIVALSGVSLTTGFLVGILLLLEREEGTLDVVLVSPLRPGEYLASKLVTVVALGVAESFAIAWIAFGPAFDAHWLVLAVLTRATLVAAVGVMLGVRYRSITRFILPAAGAGIAFDLPVLAYLGLWSSPLLSVWPTMPSLVLARAAFFPVEGGTIAGSILYAGVAAAVAVFFARRALDRHVVGGGAGA